MGNDIYIKKKNIKDIYILTRSKSMLLQVRREWPSGQSAGLWVGRPGFKSWMGTTLWP